MKEYDLNIVKEKLTSLIINSSSYKKWIIQADIYLNTLNLPRVKSRYSPQDIVHCIIEKLYTGVRRWDYDKYPDLFYHVIYLIRSVVNNLVKYVEKFTDVIICANEDEELEEIVNSLDEIKAPQEDEIFKKLLNEELMYLCSKALQKDDDALIVLLELLDTKEFASTKAIARNLGTDVKFVQSAIKRIRRKLKKTIIEYCEKKEKHWQK